MTAPDDDRTLFADTVGGAGLQPQIELAILSRPGGREYNEDACGHWHSTSRLCCVVADGAGGHGGGNVASRLAVRHILETSAARPPANPDAVCRLLMDANEHVIRHRADDEAVADMYTTVVALFIDFDAAEALWGHAGDSRLYVFRDGQMLAHTRDHSLVQSLVESGLLTTDQLRTHPRRSELHSALGTDPEALRVTTATRAWALRPGDVFLLCTDGLWEFVDEAEMSASLARSESPSVWLASLEQLVLRNAGTLGKTGHDNFSGIAIWFGDAAL